MPFGTDPTVLIVLLALAVAAVVALSWLVARRRGARGRGQSMGREESISYFRDLGGRAPGVHEEENVGRWGGRDD